MFFRKSNHSNNSLHSCTYSWGRKLPKLGHWGYAEGKQGVNCTQLSAQYSAPCSLIFLPLRVWYLVFGLVCWSGVLVFSAFQMRAAQPDKCVA